MSGPSLIKPIVWPVSPDQHRLPTFKPDWRSGYHRPKEKKECSASCGGFGVSLRRRAAS